MNVRGPPLGRDDDLCEEAERDQEDRKFACGSGVVLRGRIFREGSEEAAEADQDVQPLLEGDAAEGDNG